MTDRSDVPLVDTRTPIRPNVGTDHPAPGADHPATQRPHRCPVGQPVAIHGHAVVASAGVAIDEQVSAAMGPDMAQGHRLERIGFADGHRVSRSLQRDF